jgi:hypothetical protein
MVAGASLGRFGNYFHKRFSRRSHAVSLPLPRLSCGMVISPVRTCWKSSGAPSAMRFASET